MHIFATEYSFTGNGWVGQSVLFDKPFKSVPLISLCATSLFTTENIHLASVDEYGCGVEVYCSTPNFVFKVRVMAIGFI